MNNILGETAAVGTAVCWAFTSVFFTIGGSRIGSMAVNRIRLLLAVVFLSLTHLILQGQLAPVNAEASRWLWLGLSGIVGLVLGDGMLFQAFVIIGARLAMLLMSLVPVISSLLAWVLLGERLEPTEVAGIAITLAGITWVVNDKQKDFNHGMGKSRQMLVGLCLGIGGAAGQALGLIASKKGMEGGFPALSANLIRMIVGAGIIWSITLLLGKAGKTLQNLKDRRATTAIFGGAVFGPFVGVWLSLVAIDNAPIGIASTLMALTPVMLIPLVHWIFKERISYQAVLGTLVAVAGVAVLFMS